MKDTIVNKLIAIDACPESVQWVRDQSNLDTQSIWDMCNRGEWMLWLLGKLSETMDDRKKLVLCAVECAKLASKTKDSKHKLILQNCLTTTTEWVKGNTTVERVQDAAHTVYYAGGGLKFDAVVYAARTVYAYNGRCLADCAFCVAYFAAYTGFSNNSQVLAKAATIVRKHYPVVPSI